MLDSLIELLLHCILQDLQKEELPANFRRVGVAEIREAQKAEQDASELKSSMMKRMNEFLDFD